ncbi:hypothetical protein CONPUDRAFT_155346 [Coniophora puteana RWD-64-598 SS2]|uniref:NACHT domain-containing protein n=1 Tax=Coniophora puteana (strain RWD-64-598) TaxID=741705 RepID=A0A5M3MLB6_CONPW|nr:uncharacterized protein CONPUDRAFT_155346 [Coniophora puteana RWD-64-598 SS2]EIW79958.1 hypothetical protein CONPUDRAFT_155346 [Coniophora puteana RWD-64-598 SS2]
MPTSSTPYLTADHYSQGSGAWERLSHAKATGAEYDSNERRSFSQCLPGTRQELLTKLGKAMNEEAGQVIWLFGESGSGKSSVAHTIARQLSTQNQLAATFFFSRRRTHADRSDANLVFPTLAYQIGLLHLRARSAVVKAITDDPELLSNLKSRTDQFEHLVKAPLRSLQHVWAIPRKVIIDAVDEVVTGDRGSLESLVCSLNELVRDLDIPISHILVTSRPFPSLVTLSRTLATNGRLTVLNMQQFSPNYDIELFLKHSFDNIYDIHELSFLHERPWPSSTILTSLSTRIKGRFIVAATIVRLIENAESPSDCLDLISRMYEGTMDPIDLDLGNIDSIYSYVLSSGDEQNQRSGVEYLSDIMTLARPLTLDGICTLSGVDVSKHIVHLSAIVSLPPMYYSTTVQVYHSSLRDYLWDSSRSGNICVSPPTSHGRLAVWCFQLMKRKLLKVKLLKDEVKPPLQYAMSFWCYHLQRSDPNRQIQALTLDFVRNRAVLFLETAIAMGKFPEAMSCLIQARFTMMVSFGFA